MNTFLFIVIIGLIYNSAYADEFDSIKCNADVPKAVVGKKSLNGTVNSLERKHKDIGLKDLGADGLAEDPYMTISWLICGNEYIFLVDNKTNKGLITDVIEIPKELSKFPRALPGSHCVQQSKKVSDDVYAILNKARKAKKAWRIDQGQMKFVSIPVTDFSCE